MRTKWITPVVSAVLALGLGAVLSGCAESTKTENSDSTNKESKTENSKAEKTSLAKLLKQNKNVQCSYSLQDPKSSGTFYISGEKMRGDMQTQVVSTEQSSHLIRDTEYQYMWSDGTNQGVKMKISEIETVQTTPSTLKGSTVTTTTIVPPSVDNNTDYDYDCKSWSVDNSKFTPPSSVTFTDYAEQLKQIQNSASNIKKAACAQLPEGAARTACENS